MLMMMALALAVPTSCTDVKHVCRACPAGGDITRCSVIGTICQPSIRICRPNNRMTGPARATSARKRGG